MKLSNYLQNIFENKMDGSFAYGKTSNEIITGKGGAGVTDTFQLELANNIIKGFINNNKIEMTIQEFAKTYPNIAKDVLQILKEQGSVKFINDKMPYDFEKAPRTKNKIQVTPDI